MMQSEALSTNEVFNFMELLNSVEVEAEVDTFRTRALHYLMDIFKSTHAAFYLTDSTDKSINLDTGIGLGIDFDSMRTQYKQHFAKTDPFRQHRVEKLGVSLLSDVVSEQSFVKGSFYNEFLKQQDILHALNIPLATSGDFIGAVTLCRSANEPDFTSKDKSKALKLLPFLGRALRKSMAFEDANELNWLLSTSLQELDKVGVILLDKNLRQVYSNTVASRLLSGFNKSTGMNGEAITEGQSALPEPLIAICQQKSQIAHADAAADNEISSLIINSDCSSIRVKVKKISGQFCGERRQYLCVNMVTAEESALQVSLSRAAGFGLTKREIEIVRAVAKGINNLHIAKNLFISCNTVKNHLKNIFLKTGAHNRMELLTKLLVRH